MPCANLHNPRQPSARDSRCLRWTAERVRDSQPYVVGTFHTSIGVQFILLFDLQFGLDIITRPKTHITTTTTTSEEDAGLEMHSRISFIHWSEKDIRRVTEYPSTETAALALAQYVIKSSAVLRFCPSARFTALHSFGSSLLLLQTKKIK